MKEIKLYDLEEGFDTVKRVIEFVEKNMRNLFWRIVTLLPLLGNFSTFYFIGTGQCNTAKEFLEVAGVSESTTYWWIL